MRMHNIDVGADLRQRWLGWLAPGQQPFFLSEEQAEQCDVHGGFDLSTWRQRAISDELRDTYALWRVSRDHLRVLWLDEPTFHAAPRAVRALLVRAQVEHRRGLVPAVRAWAGHFPDADLLGQADGHRFVWWPSMLEQVDDALLGLILDRIQRLLPSRHGEVSDAVWERAAPVLPDARALAGTFHPGSGPNCFGTVMAAAAVPGAATAWMMPEPFEDWLATHARPVADRGHDADPGTVLVWRDPDGAAQHAAVTLGGGWALNKPSQLWSTPRKVLPVRDVIRVSRAAGTRLHRYALVETRCR
ncbi:hypothetical protein KDL01_35665 [Actinospica durhamensis]|uniref:Uncharacterized protein n=1 Tax=Actinospica durhamensis TaxID=1508375 RepID=A0A941IW67_9ACTN|nr:hypothetical protein [Actinospica durhamensis]MBR7838661.1 hypothetical protein [Actinospica durhamensis]